MSAREWKPGDVVTATVKGRPNVRLVAGWSKYDPQLRWCEMSPRWADGDDDECWFLPRDVTDARPLVVIDPEDREAVERLCSVLASAIDEGLWTSHVQAALREFADPKPSKGHCPSVLNIKGEHFPCQQMDRMAEGSENHDGWAHSNRDAEAIWGGPQ